MGLFSKKLTCSVCGETASGKKLLDGYICDECREKCGAYSIKLFEQTVSVQEAKDRIAMNEKNKNLLEIFSATASFESVNNKYAPPLIEFDENNRLWRVPNILKKYENLVIFSYDDIVSFELIENGKTTTKTSLGKTLVGEIGRAHV